jgi:hemerythrin-like domain-containing protein
MARKKTTKKKSTKKSPSRKKGGAKGSLAFALGKSLAGAPIDDIIQGLKKDHDDLRKFIEVLKDEKASLREKREAFACFSTLLESHSKSEEKAFYDKCLKASELKPTAQEGFVEHGLAALLLRTIRKTSERGLWVAQAKVLAEMVEHHIEEEEKELFPKAKREFSAEKKDAMGEEFVGLRLKTQAEVTEENAGVLKEA